jgi:hypothetical protein
MHIPGFRNAPLRTIAIVLVLSSALQKNLAGAPATDQASSATPQRSTVQRSAPPPRQTNLPNRNVPQRTVTRPAVQPPHTGYPATRPEPHPPVPRPGPSVSRPPQRPPQPYHPPQAGPQNSHYPRSFPGEKVVHSSTSHAIYGRDGHLRSWSGNGMTLQRGPNGSRSVFVERADHSRIAVYPHGGGWVQRPFHVGGIEYGRRTYFMNGVANDRFYRSYPFHGLSLSIYAPVRYYPADFYGWAYRPWGRHVNFSWGWQTNPWYRYYGGAFAPYAYYTAPSMFLTDYLLSSSMDAAFRQNYGNPNIGVPQPIAPLPAVTKKEIDIEIQREMKELQQERDQQPGNPPSNAPSGSIASVLADYQPHTFVTGSEVLVVDSNGSECALTPGDSVRVLPPPPAEDTQTIDVKVAWGKGSQDCQAGSTVTVALQDLQEMENFMRATADQGLDKIRTEQAIGTIPPAPPGAGAPPTPQSFPNSAPPPDTNVQTELNMQSQEADRAEQTAPKP